MKKQPEVTEVTRKHFISAFCDCYMEMPIEKITVKNIAERAGYSRVTFYNYFKDVYDLLQYIEDDFISTMAREISHNLEVNSGFHDFVFLFDRLLAENELYAKILLNNPNSTQFFERVKDRIIPMAMDSFGIPADNRQAAYAFEFYIPGVLSAISGWMKRGRDIPIEELADLIQAILLEGLIPQLAKVK